MSTRRSCSSSGLSWQGDAVHEVRAGDSQKIAFRGLGVIGRVEALYYWDGEQ
ncbi:hypothetical protein BH20ACT16_BH20ACT16_14100 [soil metagenome]|jgi:hypothetical protein